MAIIKHIAIKNQNYTNALDYLQYKYDEHLHKPVLDESGYLQMRDEFFLEGINCCPETFDLECMKLNSLYHKNQNRDDIKIHHYIISFDPLDTTECGLTGERAQALGMEFAKKNFPGHQALVCTHLDGNNGSGNIHVHIVINSLRKLDVERQPFMERPCDSRAGCKHHVTRKYLAYLKQDLMDLCRRENLHQVDLLSPSNDKITEREYWAQHRNQKKLDELNQEIIEAGLTPMNTKFQTQKQYLRDAVSDVAATATSEKMFLERMKEKYKITVTVHRGRYSYLHPERTKNITDRSLGTSYLRDTLLALFEENARTAELQKERQGGDQKTAGSSSAPDSRDSANDNVSGSRDGNTSRSRNEHTAGNGDNSGHRTSEEFDSSYDYGSDPLAILYVRSGLRLVVDLQNCTKAQLNRAYERKVKVTNLQEMAKTIAYVQEKGYDTRGDLLAAKENAEATYQEALSTLSATKASLTSVNEQIHYTGQYFANKSVYSQFLKSRNKKKFRLEHNDELEAYEAAVKYLKNLHPDFKIPSMDSLKAQKEKLKTQRDSEQAAVRSLKAKRDDFTVICKNVDAILGQDKSRRRSHGMDL